MASSGHGVEWAIEVDPVGAPNVFTTVGELTSDSGPVFTRTAHDAMTHNTDIGTYAPGILMLDEIPISVNYTYGADPAHAALKAHMLAGRTFKSRYRGPGGLANTDEAIMSGFLTRWAETNPVDGVRTAEGTFRQSGAITVDGATVG